MAMNAPLARGSMIALKARMKPMHRPISRAVLFNSCSKIQNAKGMVRWPVMRMVAHAGPSSERNGAKSRWQFVHSLYGVMYLCRSLPSPHCGH